LRALWVLLDSLGAPATGGGSRYKVAEWSDAAAGYATILMSWSVEAASAAERAGQSEAAVVDRPGSAALLPSTWGTLVFDRTPLK